MRNKGILITGLEEKRREESLLYSERAIIKLQNPVTGEFETISQEQLKEMENQGYTIDVIATPAVDRFVPYSMEKLKEFEKTLLLPDKEPSPKEPYGKGLFKKQNVFSKK